MALLDSLSASDEVMSEPRTKLSLLCPTETRRLLAPATPRTPSPFNLILWIRLFVLVLHTQHASAGTIRSTAEGEQVGEGWRPYKGKDPLHRWPQSESLCSVIHPGACSPPNGFIYTVPLQQWERGKALCVFAINNIVQLTWWVFSLFCPGPISRLDLWMPRYCARGLVLCPGNTNWIKRLYEVELLFSRKVMCLLHFLGFNSSAE